MRQSPAQWQMGRIAAVQPGAERREAAAVCGQEDGTGARRADAGAAPLRRGETAWP